MATASSPSPQTYVKCSICLEAYKHPRKLPGCSHSFCESCIVTFINKLKAEDILGLEFQCPVCRLPSESPRDQDELREWVKKMDKDNKLEAQTQGQSEVTPGELCSPCMYLNKTNESKSYCVNCDEYQCVDCSGILHASKRNRNHIMISAKCEKSDDNSKQFHKPALELMSQLLTCPEHPANQVEFYCEDHGQCACSKCATVKHRGCSNVKEVKEMLTSTPTKVSESVTEQIDYIQQVISAYKQNEDQNKIRKDNIHTEIQTIKQKVVKLLDALEDNIKQSSSALMKNINLRNLDEIENLKPILQHLKVIDYLIKTCLASATSEQVFVCVEGLKRMCQDSENRVTEKGRTAKLTRMSLKVNDMLNSILQLGPNETGQLAAIDVKESTTKVARYKQNHTVNIMYVEFRDIVATGSGGSPTYNDLLYLPNDHLLLVDSYYGYCCLVNDKYIILASRVNVSSIYKKAARNFKKLQYATFLDNDRTVLSVCQDKKICLASSVDLSIIGTIDCKYAPKCMVGLDNNTVAISWADPVAFGIIEIQDSRYSDKVYFTTDKAGRQLRSFDYMAIDKDLSHVLQSCKDDRAVYCFNYSGTPVFTYKTEDLKEPRGVAVDNDSNAYICDLQGGGIHVVSPSGIAVKVIKDGCPKHPLAISFTLKGDAFAVSQCADAWYRIHFFALVIDD